MQANGRVNILTPPNPMMLYDKPQYVSNYADAMNGNWENTALSRSYFSPENQQILQNGIRAGVYEKSQGAYVVSQQSDTQLKMIMRAIFLEHSKNLPTGIKEQIQELNQLVLKHCIPKVYSEAKSYLIYLQDASTLAVPMRVPIHQSTKQTLELKPFF
jgi:hypothetical protein